MSSLKFPCPSCGNLLRLRDRSYLGRKLKCPGCGQTVVLVEPANESPSQTRSEPSAPIESPIPEFSTRDTDAGLARLREIRRKRQRRRNTAMLVGGMLVAAVGALVFALRGPLGLAPQPVDNKPTPQTAAEPQPQPLVDSPTSEPAPAPREPVSLLMVPAGATIVIHLRPAELWQPGSAGEECVQCLGAFGQWAAATIRELTGFEPGELEELMICLIPGPRGATPVVATVARLQQARTQSELLQKFPGERRDGYEHPVYIAGEHAVLIKDDLRTIAMAPAEFAEELAAAVEVANPTAPGVEAILAQTDRNRHLVVVFDPRDVRLHADIWFSPPIAKILGALLDWLGENVETVAWSGRLNGDFSSELVLRNRDASTKRPLLPRDLLAQLQPKLNDMPGQVLAAVQTLRPRRTGQRRLIGRFPAMLKVVSLATASATGERFVRFSTLLPERAAPNLALAAKLTIDEMTRTRSQVPSATPQTDAAAPPASLAERLHQPVEVDFRRTPLEDALTFIGDVIRVRFVIDGDALKVAGYTKNMPQEFKLGKVTADAALRQILGQYEQMALVLNEQESSVLVTTKAAAAEKGLEPYPLAP